MEIITSAVQVYIDTFAGFVNPFFEWGQSIFIGLLIINLSWLCLWYAFDKDSIVQALSAYLKQYFTILLFYSMMSHPEWLMSILRSSETMGKILTGIPIDPSSIISNGIAVANKVLNPVIHSSFLTMGLGGILAFVVYGILLFCFIAVALELAVTLILCNALIVVASFFLGFAALQATTTIARQTLDVILANCVKLLGIYLVVAAGSHSINLIVNTIPAQMTTFDVYAWLIATAVLFWQVARHLPNQLARIVSGAVSAQHGTELATFMMMAPRYAAAAATPAKLATTGGAAALQMAGSLTHHAAVRMGNPSSLHPVGMMRAASGTAYEAAKASMGTVSDHFKHLLNKAAGGPGVASAEHHGAIPGFSERMYQATQDYQARQSVHSATQPVSKPTRPT